MKKAFTLAETLIALAVVGITAALCLSSFKKDSLDEFKGETQGYSFEDAIGVGYVNVLNENENDYTNIASDENKLNKIFSQFSAARKEDCNTSKLKTKFTIPTPEKSLCFLNKPYGYIELHAYSNCNNTVKTRPAYSTEERTMQNVCAIVLYTTKDSTLTVGKDLFSVALGKHQIKQTVK